METTLENVHTSDQAHKRLKKRYAREHRFRMMGLSAVLMAVFFLLFLLGSIIADAIPAFQQHYVTLEVPLEQSIIDPKKTGDPEILARADYQGMVKSHLRTLFPGVSGRREKRILYGLVSPFAGSEIRDRVLENPNLIGQTANIEVLSSDFADLYFKGQIARKQEFMGRGIASPVGEGKDIRILSTSNDFAEILASIKEQLRQRTARLFSQVVAKQTALARTNTKIEALQLRLPETGGETRKNIETQLTQLNNDKESILTQIGVLQKEAGGFDKRSKALNEPEQLNRELPSFLLAMNGGVIKINKVTNTEIFGSVLLPLTSNSDAQKDQWQIVKVTPPEANRKLSDKEVVWLDKLKADGKVEKSFNTQFFSYGASREAEVAGIWGAVAGSFFTMIITLLLSFPIGVSAAIYLEEFAPKNKITDIIEVNINNLAAVPSIVFGLLGLAVFLNFFGLPRSAPLVGGMVLALMTLPTIIIASRAALKAVPPSIREAALGLGASNVQMVFQHVLPLAMPGILTGTIIGMAQALGETAPLLMIGMVAFIVDIPGSTGFFSGFFDPATVLPVQIYMWADFPEPAFKQKTAAAIVILLGFLIIMNAIAVLLRKRFERRW